MNLKFINISKLILAVILLCSFFVPKIKGLILDDNFKDNDIIYFTNGLISDKYYYEKSVSSVIKNNRFNLEIPKAYPQMYVVGYKSEKNVVPFRGGPYFIDKSTKLIEVHPNSECSNINGKTHIEFKTEFIPYFFKSKEQKYNCISESLQKYMYLNGNEFDKKLLEYVKINPDSYVALWFLISRVNFEGYSSLYEDILYSFSNEMKKGELWNILESDIKNTRIKENEKFPNLTLQDKNLNIMNLEFPKAKYTLIDYWFNRCIPCLKSFPKLQKIYSQYNSKGFEIISISVDRTNEIDNWKKRIDDNKLDWIHYLDENGTEARIDKIFDFPTTFLLDENGKVIKKNILLQDLENFLEQELN